MLDGLLPAWSGRAGRGSRRAASSTSRSSRSQPVFGKYDAIICRHTATGMPVAGLAVPGTCSTPKPVLPRVKTVPEKRKISGTVAVAERVQVPRCRSRRSRRCTAAPGRSRCAPVKPCTVVLHCIHRNGLSVSTHRSALAEQAAQPAAARRRRSGGAAARSAPGSAARSRGSAGRWSRRSAAGRSAAARPRTARRRRRARRTPASLMRAARPARLRAPGPGRRTRRSRACASCAAVEAAPARPQLPDQLVAERRSAPGGTTRSARRRAGPAAPRRRAAARPSSGLAPTIRSQASSGSSDSVAPAGPG